MLSQGRASTRDALLVSNHVRMLQRDTASQWTQQPTIILLWSQSSPVWFATVPSGPASGCNIPCEWTTERSRLPESSAVALMLDRDREEDELPPLHAGTPVLGITWENNMVNELRGMGGLLSGVAASAGLPAQVQRAKGAFNYTHVVSYELDSHIPIVYPELVHFVQQYSPQQGVEELVGAFVARRQPAAYMAVSNCVAPIVPNRLQFAQRLAVHFPVHSYGKCMGNEDLHRLNARGPTDPAHVQRIAQYMFVLAFENSYGMHYVTEKLWNALLGGAIPIYLGAPNVASFLPHRDAVIHVADFEQPEELALYLNALMSNHSLLQRHLQWRTAPLPAQLKLMTEYLTDSIGTGSLACKVCNCVRGKLGCGAES